MFAADSLLPVSQERFLAAQTLAPLHDLSLKLTTAERLTPSFGLPALFWEHQIPENDDDDDEGEKIKRNLHLATNDSVLSRESM